MSDASRQFVSRAGVKLEHALGIFSVEAAGRICADLGCNVGGFVDCLLSHGAMRVYAIDTGYGMLAWKLRKDPRVVVMERTNAMHAELPEQADLVTVDVAWTRQRHILPAAARMLSPGGRVITLIKPHYETQADRLKNGVLPEAEVDAVISGVKLEIESAGFELLQTTLSPIRGAKGNVEVLALLKLQRPQAAPVQ
jgi:23S rRNA (cytidine1920-2'-O)/16S rRNA (cytidine1409-2'-O)-methyltransferase